MNRTIILNKIIEKYGFEKYLEIGVCNPATNFNKIHCPIKHGVDNGLEYRKNPVKYPMTSDEFFTRLNHGDLDIAKNYKWDVIFIDGLHTAEQVERDVKNAIQHIKRKGFIVLHDCNPPTFENQTETNNGGAWNGTVWKAWLKFREQYKSTTIDCDWGVGIMTTKLKQTDINITDDYNTFDTNREGLLNLISPDEFEDWIEKAY